MLSLALSLKVHQLHLQLLASSEDRRILKMSLCNCYAPQDKFRVKSSPSQMPVQLHPSRCMMQLFSQSLCLKPVGNGQALIGALEGFPGEILPPMLLVPRWVATCSLQETTDTLPSPISCIDKLRQVQDKYLKQRTGTVTASSELPPIKCSYGTATIIHPDILFCPYITIVTSPFQNKTGENFNRGMFVKLRNSAHNTANYRLKFLQYLLD